MTRISRTTDTKYLSIAYNCDDTDGYQHIVGLVTLDGRTIMLPREYLYTILDVRERGEVTCMIDGTKKNIESARKHGRRVWCDLS